MSMHDPISDLLSQINNAYGRFKNELLVPASSKKQALLELLAKEGYIEKITIEEDQKKPYIKIFLKYYEGKPVIRELKRISKPWTKKLFRS